MERGKTMVSEADKIVAKSHDAAESRKGREGHRREKKTTKKNSGGRRAQLQRALEFFSVAFANGHKENCAFAYRVWREETDYVIIVKRKRGGAQVLSVGGKIYFHGAGIDSGGVFCPDARLGNNEGHRTPPPI